MTLVDNLTNFADQSVVLILADGSTAALEIFYNGATQRWIANISYEDITINGFGLCCYPNILRQWRNILPFGISIVTANQTDPFDINDFSSGRVNMYLLSQEDVAAVEIDLFGAPS